MQPGTPSAQPSTHTLRFLAVTVGLLTQPWALPTSVMVGTRAAPPPGLCI